MVETTNDKQRAAVETPPLTTMAIVAPLVAWLIPGAGHLIQKRYVRGFLLMFAVVTMFFLGLAMQGRVYRPMAATSWISSDSSAMSARADCTS